MNNRGDFYLELEELKRLHDKKAHDYTPGERDPFFNLRLCENMGLEPWKGVLVRIGDKVSRLMAYASKGHLLVSDETVIDTFRDLAVYSILGLMLYREEKKK